MAVDERLVGQVGVAEALVTPETTADAFGNAGVDVFATPALVALFERAAIEALVPHLDPGQASVGSVIRITHRAPTPLGDSVRAVARIRSVDGAQVWFDLEAHDGAEPIGDGEHLRVVIDQERFQRRVARKQAEGTTR
jgi:fluoroacetyl-CoA thioesterase